MQCMRSIKIGLYYRKNITIFFWIDLTNEKLVTFFFLLLRYREKDSYHYFLLLRYRGKWLIKEETYKNNKKIKSRTY